MLHELKVGECNLVVGIFGSNRIKVKAVLHSVFTFFKQSVVLCVSYFLFQKPSNGNYVPSIMFDGANGVGALKMKVGLSYLGDSLQVQLYNDGNGKLNHLVSNEDALIKSVILHPKKSGTFETEWNTPVSCLL